MASKELAQSLENQAILHAKMGNIAKFLATCELSLNAWKETNVFEHYNALNRIITEQMAIGQFEAAIPNLRSSLNLIEQMNLEDDTKILVEANNLARMGSCFSKQTGCTEEAIECFARGVNLLEGRHESEDLANCYLNQGILLSSEHEEHEEGAVLCGKACEVFTSLGIPDGVRTALLEQANCLYETEDWTRAIGPAGKYIAMQLEIDKESAERTKLWFAKPAVALAQEGVADCKAGNLQPALQKLEQASRWFYQLKYWSQLAMACNNRGIVLEYGGQPKMALESYQEAIRLCDRYNLDETRKQAEGNIKRLRES